MRTHFDCIPCLIRQALNAVRIVTSSEMIQEEVLREVLRITSDMDFRQSPSVTRQIIHRLIRKLTEGYESYYGLKDRLNQLALEIYPKLMTYVERSDNLIDTALKLAAAGNLIDLGLVRNIDETHVYEAFERAKTSPFLGDVQEFSEAVSEAENILYLAGKSGEIFFDRLLITQMPWGKITVAVKGFSMYCDATIADARLTGITKLVEVIDSGADSPGTILHECNEAFLRCFEKADLIISKGQSNYETLIEIEKDIFFLLKVKCPVIANDIGCEVGSLVLKRSTHPVSTAKTGASFAGVNE